MKKTDLLRLIKKLQDGILILPHQPIENSPEVALAEECDNEIVFGVVTHCLLECQKLLADSLDVLQSALQESDGPLKEPEISDYEPCATCGFDHEYEYAEAQRTHQKLDQDLASEAAHLATQLDASGAIKMADLIDRLLEKIAELPQEKEVNRMRAENREKEIAKFYGGPSRQLMEGIGAEAAVKALQSIKEYRPLEAALSTRTCPDHPGAQMSRVGDHIWQCSMDKKIYDFNSGFTTLKGNKVPGGDVSRQTELGQSGPSFALFDTRNDRLQSR